jgi:hypothetical protein
VVSHGSDVGCISATNSKVSRLAEKDVSGQAAYPWLKMTVSCAPGHRMYMVEIVRLDTQTLVSVVQKRRQASRKWDLRLVLIFSRIKFGEVNGSHLLPFSSIIHIVFISEPS